jgi:hypothetical protein
MPARPAYGRLQYTLHLDLRAAPEIAGKRIATFSEALRAFGRPAAVASGAATPPACTASWPTLGLRIGFSAPTSASCAAQDLGPWLQVTATARRWHTYAGLHVGDSERSLHALYPNARRLDFLGHGRMWELETGGPFCDGGPPLALAARMRGGWVSALVIVHVPACG